MTVGGGSCVYELNLLLGINIHEIMSSNSLKDDGLIRPFPSILITLIIVCLQLSLSVALWHY